MLEYVGKLTLRSPEMTREDTETLRRHGFSDVQILEITMLGAWFNYMTRIADALGVEVEPWRREWGDFVLGKPGASHAAPPMPMPPSGGRSGHP
ncbi:MAG: hypothetical protein HYY85_00960 [Deltaproteobacteria bacterium]|nr:hypothetical protein [Deltaproteobacteria bacterium]